ncbi:hypothetical protein CQS04_07765 [Chryseomicrobium excrementi]|uniref:Flagellar hook-length control protein-like C-terminal domain-containing protein n=1 Tax=Chryseomicrobium excrementi TaxID=2041346 RepID=A0A2M9F0Q5_9BACL|nr:flagellar hook-length control protein FliK [Chryseomicrobium excrementi]PJK17043.1 hypothetical protein CQS04_07765 [Chryseomicrobium excrementi]
MKLSNLDLLCSVPVKQSGVMNSSVSEEASPFQTLFSEFQLEQQSLKNPIRMEGELSSDFQDLEEESPIQTELSNLADGQPITNAYEAPLVSSEQDEMELQQSELDFSVLGSRNIEQLEKTIEIPKFFVELPRRPITVVDLPKSPVPHPISVSLFERNKVFEGEGNRKNDLIFSDFTQGEKIEMNPIENTTLRSAKPTLKLVDEGLKRKLVGAPVQPISEEVSVQLEPTKYTSEVVLENELVSFSKTSEIPLNIPEDVPELEFLRHELPRVLLNPIKGSADTKGGTFRIQIFPEHLGHIDLIVTVEEGQLTAKMTTSSHLTKDVLETQLPQLRQQLTDQGISIESLEIEWRDARESPERQAQQQQPESRKQRSFMESNQQEPNESELPQDDSFDFSV